MFLHQIHRLFLFVSCRNLSFVHRFFRFCSLIFQTNFQDQFHVEIFHSPKIYWQWSCSVKVFVQRMMIMTCIELHLCLICHILMSNFLIYLKSSSWEIAHVYHISYTIPFLFLFSLLFPLVTWQKFSSLFSVSVWMMIKFMKIIGRKR